MRYLPLANIGHYRLRSALSALGIGIGVCMLITLAGLSRGTLNEILYRWAAVDADLIVCPASTDVTLASGGAIRMAYADRVLRTHHDGRPVASSVVPVYLARVQMVDTKLNVFGIRADDFPTFAGEARLLRGRLADPDGRFARWIANQAEAAAGADSVMLDVSDAELAELFSVHGGLELAIDTKLAAILGVDVGRTVYTLGHPWKIVGVFEAGAVSRAFAPLESLQYLCGSRLDQVTLLFVKLNDGIPPGPASASIRKATRQSVVPKNEYQGRLMQNFGVMYTYVDTVNAITLVIAFLFIMVTLYTMVLQRTREIAILKSMGAGAAFLMRQVLAESMLLTAAGTAVGIGMSLASAWAIQHLRPDLTVSITAGWIGVALLAAAAGGLLAGLYPAWRAIGVDVAESLGNYE